MPRNKAADDSAKIDFDKLREIRYRIDPHTDVLPSNGESDNDDPEPATPANRAQRVVHKYLTSRDGSDDTASRTVGNLADHLSRFVFHIEEEEGITDLSELETLDIIGYDDAPVMYKRDGSKCAVTTVSSRMKSLQRFAAWGESHSLLPDGIRDSVNEEIPEVRGDDWVRDSAIAQDRAFAILEGYAGDLDTYATREHLVFTLALRVGLRLGAIRAINVRDVRPDDGQIDVVHRPEIDAPLKNKDKSTRVVNVGDETLGVIYDWVHGRRPGCDADTHAGEEYHPLVCSRFGRIDKSTIRRDVYKATCCGECRTDDGKPLATVQQAHKCPESTSPHGIRKVSATWQIDAGTSKELVAERIDNSKDVLEKWYNQLSEQEEADNRRDEIATL